MTNPSPLNVARRRVDPQPIVERRRRQSHHLLRRLLELERDLTHLMARHVLPWVPGTHLPYDAQLRRRLTLTSAEVEIERLPGGWHDTRVLLLTDLHAGPFVSSRRLVEVVESLLAAAEPDLILVGGDLVSSHVRELRDIRPALERLRAPLGAWAVLGNHDHYTLEPQQVAEAVEACGVDVLHNRAVRLERDGDALLLAGVDDLLNGTPDLDAALAARRPGDVTLLLSHNPDLFFDAARRGAQLTLSGHTHGGQIRRRGRAPLMKASSYPLVNGHYTFEAEVEGTRATSQLLLSEGLGVVGLPLRITCAPEAMTFVLRRPEKA